MMKSFIAGAGLIAAATAFTQPGAQTYGSLLTPDLNSPVTTGQQYTVTWSPKAPADGVTVSLVLCNGPGSNCVLQGSAIAEGIPAASGSYSWNVPCDLPEGVQNTATGYGMLIIVDGTGEFQYSTQFSVQKGSTCGSSSGSTTTSAMTTTPPASTPSNPISGRPSGFTDTTGGWYGWTSTLNTTTISYSASAPTSAPVVTSMTSAPTTPAYVTPSTVVAGTTSAKPSTFTGAAAAPIVNVAGLLAAAGAAVLVL